MSRFSFVCRTIRISRPAVLSLYIRIAHVFVNPATLSLNIRSVQFFCQDAQPLDLSKQLTNMRKSAVEAQHSGADWFDAWPILLNRIDLPKLYK